jgi:hypothetical protein
MSSDERFSDSGDVEYTDFVPAVFARSVEDAEKYRELLDDHDIPAIIGDSVGDEAGKTCSAGVTHGVPVLVPDVLLDEASEIIADREDVDEFDIDDEADDEDDEDDEFDLLVGPEIKLDDDEDDQGKDKEDDKDILGEDSEEEGEDEENV